jgi:pimeloyl-ACP methyl ester carboxylesterase
MAWGGKCDACGGGPVTMSTTSQSPLYVEDIGHGDPIVFIHGFGASTYSWRHLMPTLSRQYRTVAIDLKGFGRSPKPYDDAYSIYDQARLVCNVIGRLKLCNITLIGHSYGGGVALAVTLFLNQQRTSCLKRLVLIDTIAYEQKLPLFIWLLRTPGVRRLGMFLFSPECQTRAILKLAYYDDKKVPYESVIQYAAALHSPGGRYALIRTAEQIVPPDISDLSLRYPSITVPVLILWGRNDEIVPIDVGERLHGALRASRFIVIDDCGHIPHEERPEVTRNIVNAFLES